MDRRTFIGSVAGGLLVVPLATQQLGHRRPYRDLGRTAAVDDQAEFGQDRPYTGSTWRRSFAGLPFADEVIQ